MQINSFSTSSASSQALHPILYGGQTTTKAATSTADSAPAKQSNASTVDTTQTTSTSSTKSTQSHGASGGGGGGAAAATEEMQASSYSTTVKGTRYSGSVEQSGGEYTASVASLPGASAIGTSAQAAENNLSARIDELV
jgi:hypothetical protein